MHSTLLHQLWRLIDTNQNGFIFKLDDQRLIQWLTQQLRENQPLSNEEAAETEAYIRSRLLLIRDVA